MASLLSITFPTHNTGNANLFKAYNRQIVTIELIAETLPDTFGVVAEPYPPIIELRRQVGAMPTPLVLQNISPNTFYQHIKAEPYALPFFQKFTFEINLEDVQSKYFQNDLVLQEGISVGPWAFFVYGWRFWDSRDVVGRPNPDRLLLPRTDLFSPFSNLTNPNSINARFKLSNDIFLTQFVSNTTNRRFLTNAPKRQAVCLQDWATLTVTNYNTGGNALQVDTFNANGQQIDRGILNLSSLIPSVTGPVPQLGVGPKDINNINPLLWFPLPMIVLPPWTGQPVVDQNVAYYEVTFGNYNPLTFGLVTALNITPSETRRFYLSKKCCPAKYRLHFVNEYGAQDNVRFDDSEVIEYNTADEFFEKNLPTVFTQKDRTRIQLIKEAETIVTLSKANASREEILWLKDVLLSPNVLLDVGGQLKAVFIVASETKLFDRDDRVNSIEITVIESTKDYSQRN